MKTTPFTEKHIALGAKMHSLQVIICLLNTPVSLMNT